MLLLTSASLFAMTYVNVNSDILAYLPEDVDMTTGMNFMKENFDMQGDAIIGVQGATYEEMQELGDQRVVAQKRLGCVHDLPREQSVVRSNGDVEKRDGLKGWEEKGKKVLL